MDASTELARNHRRFVWLSLVYPSSLLSAVKLSVGCIHPDLKRKTNLTYGVSGGSLKVPVREGVIN